MAIALPGRTRFSNRRRVAGSSRATLQEGQISASPASPKTSQALVARPSPTYSTERPAVGRGMSRVWGVRIGPGQRAEAAGDVGPRVRASRWGLTRGAVRRDLGGRDFSAQEGCAWQ